MKYKHSIPKKYSGSALRLIQDNILPSLPSVKNVVNLTESLLKYVSSEYGIRYIRKLSGYRNRGSIYTYGGKKFTVADNEPALWMFMESYQSKVLSFNHYEQNRSFPIAFAIKKEEKEDKLFSNSFKIDKGSREISFSSEGLKHFHILDCSPRNIDLNDLNVDQRMIRLLSPMNHFPFPSKKKFLMVKDFGEDEAFRELLIQILHKDYYKNKDEKNCFVKFLNFCGYSFYEQKIPDFELNFGNEKKLFEDISFGNDSKKETDIDFSSPLSNPTDESLLTITKTRFFVDERLFQELRGELKPDLIIKIKPKNAKKNHPKGIYKLPNKVILKFIEEKRKSYNWTKNKNFHQITIPSALKGYFKYS